MRFVISAAGLMAFVSAVVAQTAGFDAITTPAKNEIVPAGSNYVIHWDYTSTYAGTVTIQLLQGATPSTLQLGAVIACKSPSHVSHSPSLTLSYLESPTESSRLHPTQPASTTASPPTPGPSPPPWARTPPTASRSPTTVTPPAPPSSTRTPSPSRPRRPRRPLPPPPPPSPP